MKKWISFLAFCLVIVLCFQLVGFCVIKDDSYNRLKFHEFYAADDYDIVCIGPSSTVNSFVPQVADELLGANTFNLGTTSQQMEGTYYLTLETLKRQKPKLIVLDVSFAILSRKVGALKATQLITDYMKGWNKFRYITDAVSRDNWLTMFSRTCRYHDVSAAEIRDNLKAKLSADYRSYANHSDVYTNYNSYVGKGYTRHEKENAGFSYFMYAEGDDHFDYVDDRIVPAQLEYLRKTLALCKEQGVPVVLMSYPKSQFFLKTSGDYDSMHNRIRDIGAEYGVEYFDMAMIRDVEWTDELMGNLDHCAPEGAKLATEYLCRYIQGEEIPMVSSIREKYNRDIDGIWYTQEYLDEDTVELTWWVDTDTGREFQFSLEGRKDGVTCFETEITSENTVVYDDSADTVILRIYDGVTGEYLGNARKQ